MGLFSKFISPKYDFDTIEGISKIQIPKYKALKGIESPVNNIEYILQRKATEHKKNKRMDLAIACLKKSNQLMPHSNFSYKASDYMRYIKYLRMDGQNILADEEEKRLRTELPELFDQRINNKKRILDAMQRARKYNTDLVYITTNSQCKICKKYNKKYYSISGSSKKYAKLPDEFIKYGGFDSDCIVGVTLKI